MRKTLYALTLSASLALAGCPSSSADDHPYIPPRPGAASAAAAPSALERNVEGSVPLVSPRSAPNPSPVPLSELSRERKQEIFYQLYDDLIRVVEQGCLEELPRYVNPEVERTVREDYATERGRRGLLRGFKEEGREYWRRTNRQFDERSLRRMLEVAPGSARGYRLTREIF